MEKLRPINSLYFCLKAVRSVSGSNGSPKLAARYGDTFITAYEAHRPTSHEAIPVAGIVLRQFFPSQAILDQNSEEVRKQAVELATASGFQSTSFDMSLKLQTSLGAMCVVLARQNQKSQSGGTP